jgi:AMMECR1 domain-containing protein
LRTGGEPEVWESYGDPRQLLEELKIKAHLPPNFWSDDLCLYRFRTETFGQ